MRDLTELERMVRPGCCYHIYGPGHICGAKPYAAVHRPPYGLTSRDHQFQPEPTEGDQ